MEVEIFAINGNNAACFCDILDDILDFYDLHQTEAECLATMKK